MADKTFQEASWLQALLIRGFHQVTKNWPLFLCLLTLLFTLKMKMVVPPREGRQKKHTMFIFPPLASFLSLPTKYTPPEGRSEKWVISSHLPFQAESCSSPSLLKHSIQSPLWASTPLQRTVAGASTETPSPSQEVEETHDDLP